VSSECLVLALRVGAAIEDPSLIQVKDDHPQLDRYYFSFNGRVGLDLNLDCRKGRLTFRAPLIGLRTSWNSR